MKNVINLKLLTFSLYFLTNLSMYSQETSPTIEDTKSWITINVNTHSSTLIKFVNDKIVTYNYGTNGSIGAFINFCSSSTGSTVYKHSGNLKDIKSVSIKKYNEKNYSIVLYCASSGCFTEGVDICCTDRLKCSPNYDSPCDKIEIYVSNTIKQDNLDDRIIKAFKHLVKLSGGHIIGDTF